MSTNSKLAMNRKIAPMNALGTVTLATVLCGVCQSRDAGVSVLGWHGYETAVKGKNGFVCVVERSWMSPFDDPQFWNMMSSKGYLNDSAGHWVPHLMFHVPQTDGLVWGADLPGSPVMLNPQFQGAPEPVTVFMIPVLKWSDGTAAPTDTH